MLTVDKIEVYSFTSSSLEDDKKFIKNLGDKVSCLHKKEITEQLLTLVGSRLTLYHAKLRSKDKLPDELSTQLINLRGEAFELEQKFEDRNLDDGFFKKVLSLGESIFKLSNSLPTSTVIPLIVGVIHKTIQG